MRLPSLSLLFVVVTTLACLSASATTVQVQDLNDRAALEQGDFHNARVDADGRVVTAPVLQPLAEGLPGPVLSAVAVKGGFVIASSGPGQLHFSSGKGSKLLVELPFPLLTKVLSVDANTVAVLAGPKGGVTFVDVKTKTVIGTSTVESAKTLFDGVVHNGRLYVVGGGDEGVFMSAKVSDLLADAKKSDAKADDAKVAKADAKSSDASGDKEAPKDPLWTRHASTAEKHLRSLAVDTKRKGTSAAKPAFVLGGGKDGVVYRFANNKLSALFDGKTNEVTDVVVDDKGRVFASLVSADGKWSDGGTPRDKRLAKGPPARKVKSTEVVRIDVDGAVNMLWQSKRTGAYALAFHGGKLVVGTGSQGRLMALDVAGKNAPNFYTEADGHDELTSLFHAGKDLMATSAHTGGLLRLQPKASGTGSYYAPVVDAKHNARFGAVTATGQGQLKLFVRTGNTKKPDETWSSFAPVDGRHKSGAARARYAQVKVDLVAGSVLEGLRLAYLPQNRAPEIERVELVAPGYKLRLNPVDEKNPTRSVTFGDNPFKKTPDARTVLRPKAKERSGKQTKALGHQAFYVHVTDVDKDVLRYQWWLRRRGEGTFTLVEDFGDAPFLSVATARLAAGEYQVKVVVDDGGSNGAQRRLRDAATSGWFHVDHAPPMVSGASAMRVKGKRLGMVRVQFSVSAQHPVVRMQCAADGDDWQLVEPTDLLADDVKETVDVTLPLASRFGAVRCEVVDEGGLSTVVSIPVR